MIVAIDGPAGSGKSTIAKEIARQLGFNKLDSSREVAPLVPAEDAVHVDSTAHTIDEVVSIIEDLINQRR